MLMIISSILLLSPITFTSDVFNVLDNFRILQEQTNNIIKYADAKNVTISLIEENSKIYLSITDDGKGFDTSVQSKGIGFINIYNRADAFGGDVDLISFPNKGCSLNIVFPLTLN